MLFSTAIGLYTSRVILNVLGVEDYGIYNLVAGFVALMQFLNTSMSSATSRFITYELGKGNAIQISKTFSTSMCIHIIIGLTIIIILETLGLWFINTQLVFPKEKTLIVNWVYQFSIFTIFLNIIQVPYTATIIAYEKINIYAILEILKAILSLIIIYLVLLFDSNKLFLYSALVLIVNFIMRIIYWKYCTTKFQICKFRFRYDSQIIKTMLKFSVFDLYGNACVTIRQQGTNILINQFFGVIYNAASGIATQASSIIGIFASNIVLAFRPQIIKAYAIKDIENVKRMMCTAYLITTILMMLIFIPLYFRIDYIMHLWLINVPEYASLFCKYLLIASVFSSINSITNITIHASGNITKLSIIEGSIFILCIPLTYLAYQLGYSIESTYILWCIIMGLVVVIGLFILNKQVKNISPFSFLKKLLVPIFAILCTFFISKYINTILPINLIGFIALCIINSIILFSTLYLFWILPFYKGSFKLMFSNL